MTSVMSQLRRPTSSVALDQPVALEHQHLAALEQRRASGTRSTSSRALRITSTSAEVPGSSAGGDRGVLELDLDLDRAVLLEPVEHVGRHLDDARRRSACRAASRRVTRAGWPFWIRPESTSSIGALT